MPRIRSIKPEFFHHKGLASTSAHARLLAIGLLTLADSQGRLLWIEMQVHSQVFPWERKVNTQVLLEELIRIDYVKSYSLLGNDYIEITNFLKHQRLTGKEAAMKSKLPGPNDSIGGNRGNNGETPGCFPGKYLDAQGTGEQGNRGTGEQGLGKTQPESSIKTQAVIDKWNSTFDQKCRMTDKRRSAVTVRMKDPFWAESWDQAIEQAGATPFLRGVNDKNWFADFDWFLKPDSLTKIIEGKYGTREHVCKVADMEKLDRERSGK